MVLDYIYFDGEERRIFRDCVDDIRMGGNTEKLNKVQHSTVYRMNELE